MAAWEHGTRNEEGYTSLLYRIHTQEEAKTRDNNKETESEKRTKRAARAQRLAAEGALAKGVQGLSLIHI
eukprot:12448776-Heterocapsa_arctica.AAC.1